MLSSQNHGIYKKLYASVNMPKPGSTKFLKNSRNQKLALGSLASNFYTDKSARSRAKAYSISRKIYNYAARPEIKQQVVEDHLRACAEDRSPYLRKRLSNHLLHFDAEDFNDASHEILKQLIETGKNKKHYIIVAGYKGLSDVLPDISNYTKEEIYSSFDRVQGLARVGDTAALNICREIIEEYPLDLKFFNKYLPGLAFSHDRQIFDLIIEEILSDENTELIGQRIKDYQRYFMLKNIIPSIYEYPYRFVDETQLMEEEFYHQLQITMDWLRANKYTYTINQTEGPLKESRYHLKDLTDVRRE